MSAFAILPIMFPQSDATNVDAGHEAMKGGINNSYDQSLARGVKRIPYKQRRVPNVNRTKEIGHTSC